MTNQNVMLSESKPTIGVKITLTLSNSALFSQPSPAGYITIPRKKLLKKLDDEGGTKLNAWVDSMRDSSPTRAKSTASVTETEEQSSWIVRTYDWSLVLLITIHTHTHTHILVDFSNITELCFLFFVIGSSSISFKQVWGDCECFQREEISHVSWLRRYPGTYCWRPGSSFHDQRGLFCFHLSLLSLSLLFSFLFCQL